MYSAAFIFEPDQQNDEFHRLNALIYEAAKATKGFIGEETWHASTGKRINVTYYWETLEALKEFASHPKHLEAKRQYKSWYKGFHIVISEIIKSYGDDVLEHFTPNRRKQPPPFNCPTR